MSSELSRFSYMAAEETPYASSPTLQEDRNKAGFNNYMDKAREDYGHVDIRDSIYNTPSILDEDENNPTSHAAMT